MNPADHFTAVGLTRADVTDGAMQRITPQWSLQNRPYAVRAKPAKGDAPEQDVFIVCWPSQASLFSFAGSAVLYWLFLTPRLRRRPGDFNVILGGCCHQTGDIRWAVW